MKLGIYSLVYKGEHHEVYCNGTFHLKLSGGGFGTAPARYDRYNFEVMLEDCDCWRYKVKPKIEHKVCKHCGAVLNYDVPSGMWLPPYHPQVYNMCRLRPTKFCEPKEE